MKATSIAAVLIVVACLLVSCSTLPQEVIDAHIQTTTNSGVVAGRAFVASWTAVYDDVYNDQSVAVLAADELAKEGWHDIWILVEYVSIAPSPSVYLWMFSQDKWRITIYR
jgi:hypothetical protein